MLFYLETHSWWFDWERPYRFLRLNTLSPVGGTVWEGCGAGRRWSLAGGSLSLRGGLWPFLVWSHFLFVPCLVLLADAVSSVSCSYHHACCLWNQESNKLFLLRWLWWFIFPYSGRKAADIPCKPTQSLSKGFRTELISFFWAFKAHL